MSLESATPREVPLPPVPSNNYFSELQWKTLFALADTVIPSIHNAATTRSSSDKVISDAEWNSTVSNLSSLIGGPDATKIATQYLQEDVSSNPVFRSIVVRILGNYVHDEGRNGFGLIMNALNTRAGSLILTGSTTPIQDQPVEFQGKGLPRVGYFAIAPYAYGLPRTLGHCKESLGYEQPNNRPCAGFPTSSRPR